MNDLNKIDRKFFKLHAVIALMIGISGTALAADYSKTSYTSNKAQLNADDYNQNWDQTMRDLFYYTAQGSRLIPYQWFLALEQANSTTKFADPANITRFGLIYDKKSADMNPDKLPIGFVKDKNFDGKERSLNDKYPVDDSVTGAWLGLNCAACHTNDITFNNKTIRIDGAPTLADLGAFFQELSDAVKATRPDIPTGDKTKFERFAQAVYGHKPSDDEIAKLKTAYQAFALRMEGQALMRTPPSHAGAGRIDALGQIINALSVFDLEKPSNLRPPSAPVSYPFLWVAPHLDYVQWVPVAGNPLTRNAGEVLGVFGETTFNNPSPANRLHSSVLLNDLYNIEDWLTKLNPPPWREDVFGTIDKDRVVEGKKLFDKDCRSCHSMPPFAASDMTDPTQNMKGLKFIKIKGVDFTKVGTDTTYSLNLLSRLSETGSLGPVLFANAPIIPAANLFLGSVGGTVVQALADQNATLEDKCKFSGYRFKPENANSCNLSEVTPGSVSSGASTLKAGPLLGIWATGPFLHNGSVPNIFELLSPPNERSKKFWVGNRELDNAKLGFVSNKRGNGNAFEFDTHLAGNSNAGHVYPAKPYSRDEKWNIIEYLKQNSTDWRPNKAE